MILTGHEAKTYQLQSFWCIANKGFEGYHHLRALEKKVMVFRQDFF